MKEISMETTLKDFKMVKSGQNKATISKQPSKGPAMKLQDNHNYLTNEPEEKLLEMEQVLRVIKAEQIRKWQTQNLTEQEKELLAQVKELQAFKRFAQKRMEKQETMLKSNEEEIRETKQELRKKKNQIQQELEPQAVRQKKLTKQLNQIKIQQKQMEAERTKHDRSTTEIENLTGQIEDLKKSIALMEKKLKKMQDHNKAKDLEIRDLTGELFWHRRIIYVMEKEIEGDEEMSQRLQKLRDDGILLPVTRDEEIDEWKIKVSKLTETCKQLTMIRENLQEENEQLKEKLGKAEKELSAWNNKTARILMMRNNQSPTSDSQKITPERKAAEAHEQEIKHTDDEQVSPQKDKFQSLSTAKKLQLELNEKEKQITELKSMLARRPEDAMKKLQLCEWDKRELIKQSKALKGQIGLYEKTHKTMKEENERLTNELRELKLEMKTSASPFPPVSKKPPTKSEAHCKPGHISRHTRFPVTSTESHCQPENTSRMFPLLPDRPKDILHKFSHLPPITQRLRSKLDHVPIPPTRERPCNKPDHISPIVRKPPYKSDGVRLPLI